MALTSDITSTITQINTYIKTNGNEEVTATIMNTILQLIVGLISEAYTGTFDNADLDADYEITITHGLATLLPQVLIYDNNNQLIGPANVGITVVDDDNIKLSLQDSITGTWSYLIIKHD